MSSIEIPEDARGRPFESFLMRFYAELQGTLLSSTPQLTGKGGFACIRNRTTDGDRRCPGCVVVGEQEAVVPSGALTTGSDRICAPG